MSTWRKTLPLEFDAVDCDRWRGQINMFGPQIAMAIHDAAGGYPAIELVGMSAR